MGERVHHDRDESYAVEVGDAKAKYAD